MAKAGRAAVPKSAFRTKLEQQAAAATGRAEFGVSSALPALSVCRLEAPEDLLKKLQEHVDDPALADFTCPICWDPFWQPVRTVCGHAFCEGCLLKAVLAQLTHQQPDVCCPLCRHPLHVDDVSVDQALLTRIRLALTERDKGKAVSPNRRGSGRVHRGLAVTGNSTPSASSSASASAACATIARPRTSPSTGFSDLEGLAVTPSLAVSGRPQTEGGQSSRMGPLQRVGMRAPRTAPSNTRSSDEGLTGLVPEGWFSASASLPNGSGSSATSRPGTSPVVLGSSRDAPPLASGSTSAVLRTTTAPEGSGGRRNSARQHQSAQYAHGPPPSTPSRRVPRPPPDRDEEDPLGFESLGFEPLGFEPLPGVSGAASESAPSHANSTARQEHVPAPPKPRRNGGLGPARPGPPTARRAVWGPSGSAPAGTPRGNRIARNRASGTGASVSGRPATTPGSMAMGSSPACIEAVPRSGGELQAVAAGVSHATGARSNSKEAVTAVLSHATGPRSKTKDEARSMPASSQVLTIHADSMPTATYGCEERLYIASPEPSGHTWAPELSEVATPAGFGSLFNRSPTPRLVPARSHTPLLSSPSPAPQAIPHQLNEQAKRSLAPTPCLGSNAASSTAAVPAGGSMAAWGIEASFAVATSTANPSRACGSSASGNFMSLHRGSHGGRGTPSIPTCAASENVGLVGSSWLMGSTAGDLGWGSSTPNPPETAPRGGVSRQTASPSTQGPEASGRSYAADFAFADRYRQLLEEGA